MSHARNLVAQRIVVAEDPDLPADLRADHADRAREHVDGAVEGVPVSVVKTWRDGDLYSVRYCAGSARGDVAFVAPDDLDEWTPAEDGDRDG